MTSVERLKEYSDIEPEVEPSKYKLVVSEDWVSDGRIEFNNLHFSHYPEGPEVLRGVSFVIEPREKVDKSFQFQFRFESTFFRLVLWGELVLEKVPSSLLCIASIISTPVRSSSIKLTSRN